MSRNSLNIITSREANKNDELFIIDSNSSSILAYKKDGDTMGLTEGSSRFRPIHSSELTERLKERGYNLMGTKFIRRVNSSSLSSDLCYDLSPSQNQIPTIITQYDNLGGNYKDNNGNTLRPLLDFSCCGSDLPLDEIRDEYNLIYDDSNMNTKNEISFYSSSMSSINLIENITEIELIKHNSDSYTNILNISELIYYNAKPYTGLLDITVEYSKAGRVYVKDLSFQAFKYIPVENSDIPILDINSYVTDINNEVQVEYINNTIRVNSMSSDIDECIISRCIMTYGNL